MNENGDDKKLDWMYKGANSLVEREEYLLGRSVDKTIEQINAEEKEKKFRLVPPKNHVEHECIPPSIRDFNKIIQAEQVDISAKLQEDPLVAIKKREEEARRQFLQNPVQLKKLQDALKAQELKKRKKHKKSKDSDSDNTLDDTIAKKLKLLKNKSCGILSKASKKKSNDNSLDTILMHKFNQLKDKLSQDDLNDILAGKDSDREEETKSKRRKKTKSTSSEDSEFEQREKPQKHFRREISSSDRNVKISKHIGKTTRDTNTENKKYDWDGKKKPNTKHETYSSDKSRSSSRSNSEERYKHRRKSKKKYKRQRLSSEEIVKKSRSSSSEVEKYEKTKYKKQRNKNMETDSAYKTDHKNKNSRLSRVDSKYVKVTNLKKEESYRREKSKKNQNLDKRSRSTSSENENTSKSKHKNQNQKRKYKYRNCSSSSEDNRCKEKGKSEKISLEKSFKSQGNFIRSKAAKNRSSSTSSDEEKYSSNNKTTSKKIEKYIEKSELKYSKSNHEDYHIKKSKTSKDEYRKTDTGNNKVMHKMSEGRSHNAGKGKDESKIKTDKSIASQSDNSDSDLESKIILKLRKLRDSVKLEESSDGNSVLKTDKEYKRNVIDKHNATFSGTANSSVINTKEGCMQYDSENDEHVYKPLTFGLVKSDGTQIALNKNSEKLKNVSEAPKKVENLQKLDKPKVKRLTDKEKEKLRREMMLNAEKRDQERSENLRKYREENKREQNPIHFDKEFVHKELLKTTKDATVETRIKANLNNIQRSSRQMESGFSKRN